MSKHICRGYATYHQMYGWKVLEPQPGWRTNCTVVDDAAGIPVREAIALARAYTAMRQYEDDDGDCLPLVDRLVKTFAAYNRAVERIKARRK